MGVQQHYLGWDQPAAQTVRDWLVQTAPEHPLDLSEILVLVPTRQAGRRLREALAVYGQAHGTAVLAPRVVTPTGLLRETVPDQLIAGSLAVSAAWARLLEDIDLARYPGLFPHPPPARDFSWALETGEMIQSLRTALSEGGYRLQDVVREHGNLLEEPERWKNLADLEIEYLRRLEALGYADDLDQFIKHSRNPEVPKGITRIVLAAVPDPAPVVIKVIDKLSETAGVDVLIQAPEKRAGDFDAWGRPVHETWHHELLDVPDSEQNILLAGNPVDQSHKVLEVIAAGAAAYGPQDIAIGVPDSGVTPFLAAELAKHDLQVFDPAGEPVSHHPLYQALEALHGVLRDRTYRAFAAYLRQAPVLHTLAKAPFDVADLLTELDGFQNTFLPQTLDDIRAALKSREAEYQEFTVFTEAFKKLDAQFRAFDGMDTAPALRQWLIELYRGKEFNPAHETDVTYMEVARLLDRRLIELEDQDLHQLSTTEWLEIMLRDLSGETCRRERDDAIIDLEGWLELPWNDAPLLIVTGMNEGFVPDGTLSDVFLPDSLRGKLGLRHDGDRLARDSYLMQVLVQARPATGRAVFIAGKTTITGDPLKPSRLLFRCTDEELPGRARRLFGDPGMQRENNPFSISFTLDAVPPSKIAKSRLPIARLSVTDFRSYLVCPFRFYLSRILDMGASSDDKEELDAMDFGQLVHYALEKLGLECDLAHSGDEAAIKQFLWEQVDRWARRRFTRQPPLPVTIQLAAARQRLASAARVQVDLTRDGWKIVHTEQKLEMEVGGITIVGKIDRIDQHPDGRTRVLDYKSADRGTPADEAHLSTTGDDTPEYAVVPGLKNRAWADLQLPLYRMLLEQNGRLAGPAELGYFNLTKAAGDCGIYAWEDYSEDIHASACTCMQGVLHDIAACRFWPPKGPKYDDFENIFLGDAEGMVDGKKFERFW